MAVRDQFRCGVWLLLLSFPLLGGPHRYKHHPNPHIYIVDIEDSGAGFLWLATQDGLYRFDGSHYIKAQDFPFSSARAIARTNDGVLWIASRNGLAKFKDRFDIVRQGESIQWLAAVENTAFFSDGKSIHRADASGRLERVENSANPAIPILGLDGQLRFRCGPDYSPGKSNIPRFLCALDPRWGEPARRNTGPFSALQVVGDRSGRLWANDNLHATLTRDGAELSRIPVTAKTPLNVVRLRRKSGSRILFLNDNLQDLDSGEVFHASEESRPFHLTAAAEDSKGRLWEARWKFGLTEWLSDPNWLIWPAGHFAAPSLVSFAAPSGGTAPLITANGVHSHAAGTWTRQFPAERPFRDLISWGHDFLAIDPLAGIVRLSREGKLIETLQTPKLTFPKPAEYVSFGRDSGGRVWIATGRGLLRPMVSGHRLLLQRDRTSFPTPDLDIADIEIDSQGIPWIAHNFGLERFQSGQWTAISTDRSFPSVRSFALVKDRLWLAHHAAGAYSSLKNENGTYKLRQYPADEGYGPARTLAFFTDSRGWLWRSTPDGMYVTKSPHPGPGDWIRLDPGNGLSLGPIERRGFFEDKDRFVWLAGERGVARVKPGESWFDAPNPTAAPLLTELRVDAGRARIKIGGLDANPFAPEPYRYRLVPLFDEWRSSADGLLDFRDLPQRDYRIEARYAGLGSTGVLTHSFRVGPPSNYPAWLLSLLALATALAVLRTPWGEKLRYFSAKRLHLWKRRSRFARQAVLPGQPLRPGTILNSRYIVDNILAQGGFSTVYSAIDRGTGLPIAIKAADPAGPNSSWVRNRYAHELNALRSIRHAGVVECLDSWIDSGGELYFAMPLLQGQPLRHHLAKGPLDPARAMRLSMEIAEALSAVHARGIAHLDVKPENLIVTAGDRTVLIDFGTSGLRAAVDELAMTKMLAGSAFYLAPERITGHYSTASDVYSFGIVVLEMLTGKKLCDFDASWHDEEFQSELASALQPALGENAALFSQLLARCFEAQPSQRPKDLVEFIRAARSLVR